jgi:hypothetical protein
VGFLIGFLTDLATRAMGSRQKKSTPTLERLFTGLDLKFSEGKFSLKS